LFIMSQIRKQFKDIYNKYGFEKKLDIPNKENYTNVEIMFYILKIKKEINNIDFIELKKQLTNGDKQQLYKNIQTINEIIEKNNMSQVEKIKNQKMKKN